MREVLAQLGLEEERELDVAKARLGLRLADPQAATVEIEPGARRARQLRDARARQAERREQRAAPVLLVRRQLGLPLAGDLEEVDDLVGSRNVRRDLATFMRRRRPRAGFASSTPYSTASSRTCARTSSAMLTDRGDSRVRAASDGSRRRGERRAQRSARERGDAGCDRGASGSRAAFSASSLSRRCHQRDAVTCSVSLRSSSTGRAGAGGARPARDLAHDALQIDASALLVPTLV
jgi:hypothetical protein